MALPSSRTRYDVFLSFRGDDTRRNFSDHLYNALKRYGIRTFRDNNDLQRGKEIRPELLKAIEGSRFSIIVFSRNYASSTWCLDELAHIMECSKTLGQTVVPVFYDVEPSDVRKQKRSFEEAFAARHEDLFKEERWRNALREAADLAGVDVRNDADGHESTIIENIAKDISGKLNRERLSTAINPVGLCSRASEVISLLYDESIDVRIVGICGMGGIGKTTIAKEVYNLIFPEFEGCSFIANVREKSGTKGIVHLQKQLLSEIVKGKHEKIYSEDRGLKVIEETLQCMKVLIVLDDVDKLEQLNKVLGNLLWLSPGSKIIITTRVEDLLLPSRGYRQYRVKELDQKESLQLLSINAFNQLHPMKTHMKCAERVVHYAGGIPLALEVLGFSLSGQSVDVWNGRLEKLKAIPDTAIHTKLEISYISLDDMEKNLFLDIACFFNGKDKDYFISILEGCGFFPSDGISTLIKRCLVKIDSHNRLMMHDLLQDLGREIIRQECVEEPGNRSRVWRRDEAFDLLRDKTGTNKVGGLSLNLPPGSSELLRTEAFRNMNKLRLLHLSNVNLTGSYEYLPTNLRWLCWHVFPLESIPADFHLRNLVALDMCYSSLKQVWQEAQVLGKLKFLNLSHSHKLTRTPDFTGLPILEKLMLKDCTSLTEVHKSVGLLSQLVVLNLKDCTNLKSLPNSICALRSLKNLNISGCSKLEELPEELGNMESLDALDVDGTAISQVPRTISALKNLGSLSLHKCQLTPLPPPMKGPSFIDILPASLKHLDLRYCSLSDDMIPNDLQNLSQLKSLKLCGNYFSSLPASISLLPNLRHLWLNECKKLQSVPELESSLLAFQAMNCTSLERIHLTSCREKSELEIHDGNRLFETEGFLKFEPTGAETVKELLGTHGLSIDVSIASVRMNMINNLTRAYRISPLQVRSLSLSLSLSVSNNIILLEQGLPENGIYSFFLPGSEIPSWFNHQSTGDSVTFSVPGCKILDFIVCGVYTSDKCNEPYFISPHIKLAYKKKVYDWVYKPSASSSLRKLDGNILWWSYWRFDQNQLRHDVDEIRTMLKNELGGDQLKISTNELGGDQVKVSIEIPTKLPFDMDYGIPVKKYGFHVLNQKNDEVDSGIREPAMLPMPISRGSSQHHRTLQCPIACCPLSFFF